MNLHSFVSVVAYGILPMVVLHNVFGFMNLRTRSPVVWERWMWAYVPIFGGFEFLVAVDALIRKHYVTAVVCTAAATYVTYVWWNDEDNRRKRKKLVDRAANRVAMIGSRLRVVRPSEG